MNLVRSETALFAAGTLALPAFFPSVSSLKTNLRPSEYVRALSSLSPLSQQFLVSAYDLERTSPEEQKAILEALVDARKAGARILLDSGNYEGYWRNEDARWTETEFHRALQRQVCDLAFGFDSHLERRTGSTYLSDTVDQHGRDVAAARGVAVAPIVHGASDLLPALCAEVVQRSGAKMVAVAERELGETIVERLETTKQIRVAVDRAQDGVALHLLGTGNPISIALFVGAGADSFDGLEWCQTVVDFDTSTLFHLSHYDFLRGQTSYASAGVPTRLAVLAHNLEFMQRWVEGIRGAARAGDVRTFCRLRIPDRAFQVCEKVLWPQ